MEDKKYQIFVSSTYKDLIEARDAVVKTILSLYHFPIGMEMFSADDAEQWEIISETISVSDYYVVIIGHRYGSETSEGISFTEKEYDYARIKGIPVLAFIRKRDVATKPEDRDDAPEKIKKLQAFIDKATADKMCDYWETTDELARKVAIALTKSFSRNPRIGWVRADKLKPQASDEYQFDNPSRFCSETEPIAVVTNSSGNDIKITIPNSESLFMRLIPKHQVKAIESTKKAGELIKAGQLITMGRKNRDSYQYGDGRNKYGACVYSYKDDKAVHLTQLFLSNQIWGVDLDLINKTTLLQKAKQWNMGDIDFGYFPSVAIEEVFNNTLESYLKFAAQKLGL